MKHIFPMIHLLRAVGDPALPAGGAAYGVWSDTAATMIRGML